MLARRLLALSGVVFLFAVAALLGSCGDQTAPRQPVVGHFGLAPRFEADAAGIVPLARGRFILTRIADGTVAKDTIVEFSTGQDSVDLALSVLLNEPNEVFQLRIALISPAGDTVFRAGPVEVSPVSSGTPPLIPITLVYTGIGANAGAVDITSPLTALVAGDTVEMVAVALDSSLAPIPGTPIGWRSLNPTIAAVPDVAAGRVVGLARGTARIVAELLTGPADTVGLSVTLPPTNLVAESGSGQAGAAGSILPTPLVARVTASDGLGVSGVWIRFAVVTGGGTLSADSLQSDSAGRASVTWTLGQVIGSQTVRATTAALPSITATFTASSQSTGPGGVAIEAGDGQTAVVATAVAIAPSVKVTDAQGNAVPNAPVNFAVTQGGGSVTPATRLTDSAGVVRVDSWTLGPAVGINTLTARVDTLTPVLFTATATGPGGAYSMTLNAGNGQTVLAGTAVPIPPSVIVRDTANAPLAGVPVRFAVTGGNGTIGDTLPVTDAGGIASPGTWTLGAPGLNTITASLAGLPDVGFQATAIVGPPANLVIVSGNAQTDTAGQALALPLVVEVRDSAGNPVANTTVTWATLDGGISPASSSTDAAGQAQATWTLGVNRINQTATAAASGLTPAVFAATAVFPNPTILLTLAGTDRIRLSDSTLLDVTLSAPAPVGGVVVNFTVDNPSIVGLDTTDLSIPEAGATTQQWLYGLSSGTTTVRATATGYADGALSVLVTVQVLSMPTALNVPYGGTASLPLQISTPAPTGGVTVTLVSDNPTAVGVVTPTVIIPQGQQTANAIVSGVAPGAATITGSTAAFGIDQTAAATRANLNIIETASTFPSTFVDTLTVRLESSGAAVAAPGAGVSVTLTARNTDCVAATSPVTIPTGLVSATFIVSYGGVANTPCNTYLVATAPGIDPDSAYITVNPPPGITAPAYTLGAGLQLASNGYGYLGATNHGGVNVVIKSANTAIALVSPDQSTVGGDSLVVFVPNGQQYFYYNLQALEGVA
ncbi:MAG: Ig-like domain-containing protein, partial [Gemmatimonadota bacterium]|nr:Ig-like domain-containing protein [Gemmatimonadota bacterium]